MRFIWASPIPEDEQESSISEHSKKRKASIFAINSQPSIDGDQNFNDGDSNLLENALLSGANRILLNQTQYQQSKEMDELERLLKYTSQVMKGGSKCIHESNYFVSNQFLIDDTLLFKFHFLNPLKTTIYATKY